MMHVFAFVNTQAIDAYKQIFKNLHPFEATVAELTIVAQVKNGKHI